MDWADKVITFCNRLTIPNYGDDWLRCWQIELLQNILDESNQYNYIWAPKGSGKSSLYAAICLAYLTLKSRQQIFAQALTAKQLQDGVWRFLTEMVEESPTLKREIQLVPSKLTAINHRTKSKLTCLHGGGKTAHGKTPDVVLIDELGQFSLPKETTQYGALRSSLAKAYGGGKLISISHAGVPHSGIGFDEYMKSRQYVYDGANFPGYWAQIWEAQPDEPWDEWETVIKCNPAMQGDRPFKNHNAIRNELEAAKISLTQQIEYENWHLNRWVCGTAKQFVRIEDFDKCDPTPVELRGRPIAMAYDLSSKIALTSLAAFDPVSNGCKTWNWIPRKSAEKLEREEGYPFRELHAKGHLTYTEEDTIRVPYLVDQFRSIVKSGYHPVTVAFDPWQDNELGQSLIGLGYNCFSFHQKFAQMNAPLRKLEALITGHDLKHGGDLALRHALTGAVSVMTGNHEIRLDREKSLGVRIDPAIALAEAIGISGDCTT